MPRKYPTRPDAHNLEEASRRFLSNHLPKDWTHDVPDPDYGVDVKIDIFENKKATGLELLVQLKASQRAVGKDNELIQIKTSTHNYLRDKLQVVMLVKYVAEENEAYWILLADIQEPNQNNKQFNVRIPKSNKLSHIDWQEILHHVREVSDEKLTAGRKHRLERTEGNAKP